MLIRITEWLVFDLLRMDRGSRAAESLAFFIYDSTKIVMMLFLVISLIGVIRSFLPQDRVKKFIHRGGFLSYFFASLFGAITPFCSCSSIPLFFGFLKSGIPLGISLSFLITSPIINEYLVVLMLGFFGWKITAAYIASGMIIGIICGLILGEMKLEKYLVKDIVGNDIGEKKKIFHNFMDRIRFGLGESVSIIKRVWFWILIGVGVGAIIHNYIPKQAIEALTTKAGWAAVPVAVLIGVPMYGSCAAIVPIAVALFEKGIQLGTALSFMMAVSALSLPEAILLRRAMKLNLILVFFAITTVGIILTGYLFNFLQRILI